MPIDLLYWTFKKKVADNKKDVELVKAMADKALSKIVKAEDKTSNPANQLSTAADALIKAIAEHQ